MNKQRDEITVVAVPPTLSCSLCFVHATCLSLITCGLGDRIQNWPYLQLPCLSQSSVLHRPDKNEKPLQLSAVTAEDGQYAARCRKALLRHLLSASPQHGRWAIETRAFLTTPCVPYALELCLPVSPRRTSTCSRCSDRPGDHAPAGVGMDPASHQSAGRIPIQRWEKT